MTTTQKFSPAAPGSTCTVRLAVTGLCGAPATITIRSRSGETFHECADHAGPEITIRPEIEVGSRIDVVHGVKKTGTVRRISPTFAWIEVPIYGGKATKVVRFRREDIVR